MSYLDPLITEIEQFLEAFDKGDKIIDTEKGQYDYEKTEYNGKITNGGTLADNLASAISLYKQYKNSTTPIRQIHIISCHEWLTKAKTNRAIIDNIDKKQFEELKKVNTELKKELENEKINRYKVEGRLEEYRRKYEMPDKESSFTSKVEDNESDKV